MKDNQSTLGRNFADLMQENVLEVSSNEEVLELNLDLIQPNADQPRSVFDMDALNNLANSIKEHGIIQPVIVKPKGSQYVLVAGERRVKAAKLAGRETIPAIVRDYNMIHLSEIALIENLQREDLTPIEEAIAFQTIITKYGITHEELGQKIGKSRVYVTNILGLLRLPVTVIQSVNHGLVTMGHARALSKLTDQRTILQLHEEIIREELTVRELESRIRNRQTKHKSNVSKSSIDRFERAIKDVLPEDVRFKLSKTQLSIKFDNEDELNSLYELLKKGGKQ